MGIKSYNLQDKGTGEDGIMGEIKTNLLKAAMELSEKCESYKELIERLKNEGKSISEIEKAVMEFTRINNLYTSIEKAVRKY